MTRRLLFDAWLYMYLIADTHVHLYPCYDIERVFVVGVNNLQREAIRAGVRESEIAAKVLCLTERFDCDYFESFAPGKAGSGFQIEFTAEPEVHRITLPELNQELFLVAGRQIVTAERIEVLALACLSKIADGLSLSETLEAVRAANGIPVLSWAPGKWLFKRGKLVAKAFRTASPGSLVCGDTSLRPPLCLEPLIMKRARKAGFQVVAGSDPLPFPGEERQCGSYATVIPCSQFSRDEVASTLRKHLLSQLEALPLAHCGSRSSTFEVLSRLRNNQAVRLT